VGAASFTPTAPISHLDLNTIETVCLPFVWVCLAIFGVCLALVALKTRKRMELVCGCLKLGEPLLLKHI
jgi:hypothetical protein